MSISTTSWRRPTAKVAVVLAAAAALAGGVHGAQAANADDGRTPAIVRAEEPKGDLDDGRVVAGDTPGNDERPAPAPAMERADEPKGDDHAGVVVPRDTPGFDEQPAPAPAGDQRSR